MNFREIVDKVQEEMRLKGISESEIQFATTNLPDPSKVEIADLIAFYKRFREIIVVYLHRIGRSATMIRRDLGGGSIILKDIIEKYDKEVELDVSKLTSLDEVLKGEEEKEEEIKKELEEGEEQNG